MIDEVAYAKIVAEALEKLKRATEQAASAMIDAARGTRLIESDIKLEACRRNGRHWYRGKERRRIKLIRSQARRGLL